MDVMFSFEIRHLSVSLFENYDIITNCVEEENNLRQWNSVKKMLALKIQHAEVTWIEKS